MPAKGIDTTFLIQIEVREVQHHTKAREFFEQELFSGSASLALAPQVLTEFVHIVTDGNRFERSLSMSEAVERARFWWNAKEVKQVMPDAQAVELTLAWLKKYRLGRKRVLDTQIAATYHSAGIPIIVSSNSRDFKVYGCFKVIHPAKL